MSAFASLQRSQRRHRAFVRCSTRVAIPSKVKNTDAVKFLEAVTLEELQAFMAPVKTGTGLAFWDDVTADVLIHGNETAQVAPLFCFFT